jgi:Fe-S-cluster-containing hydrogenase component 2
MTDIDKIKSSNKFMLELDEIKKTPGYPSEERLNKGPTAVIECVEEIPCNPCETVCSKNSIAVGKPITNLPRLVDQNSCNGCGNCVVRCPGLAIFIVDKTFSEKSTALSLPYELLPLPEINEKVKALNRNGEYVCEGTVHKVRAAKSLNHTNVVTIIIPKEFTNEVRFFKRGKK